MDMTPQSPQKPLQKFLGAVLGLVLEWQPWLKPVYTWLRDEASGMQKGKILVLVLVTLFSLVSSRITYYLMAKKIELLENSKMILNEQNDALFSQTEHSENPG